MYAKLAEFVVARARLILWFSIGLAVLCATNIPKLGFDFTPQQLFRSTSDSADYRETFAERFGREDNLVFIVVEADDVFRPDILEFSRNLTTRLRALDFVDSADSIATMEIPRPGDSPGTLSTEPIIGATGDITPELAQSLRELTRGEPLVRGQLVADSESLTAVLVWIDEEIQDITVLEDAIATFESEVEATGVPDGVETSMGGVPFLRVEIVDELKFMQVSFIPATGVAYFLILLVLFRRKLGVLGPLGVVVIAVLMTVTMMVATQSSINIINNILPMLIFIICVSDSIHMLVRDAEETELGLDREQSVKEMIRYTGAACLLTTSTTAVGFFSLLAADTEILQDFGWQAGMGVMFGYLVTIFFLPALAVKMQPVDRSAMSSDNDEAVIERSLRALGEFVLDRPKSFIALGLVIAGVAAGFGSRVQIDTVLLEVYEPGHPAYESTIQLESELSGILPVEISLESDDVDAFKDPEVFAKMNEIQRFAEKDEVVLASQSLVDFHQAARAALLGDPAQRAVMPESREQVEQLHLLIAGAPDSRTGVNRFVTQDFKHTRILLRVRDAGAREQLRLGNKLDERLDVLFKGTNIRHRITGDAYVASAALDSFIRDLFISLMLAMVIIFGMMTLVFRSLTIGLISTIPNLIPLVLTFGYMGLADIDLNTTTVIIFAISLGLAVDDTIHFLARFREELDKHPDDVREAVLGAYNGAGRAIMITSVMLLLGLTVLLFSSFIPTQYFATLTAITIAGAILGDLLILPPILYLVYRWKAERSKR